MTAVDHAELKRVEDELVQMLAPNQGERAHPAFGLAVRIQNAHAALLSEIEGLKAERDRLMRASNKDNAIIKRMSERWDRAALRTQAPDSWRPIETAPKPGIEFQVWWKEQWQPRARFNPETHAFELWGRTDYDTEGWECFSFTDATHWMPEPKAPLRPQTAESGT